MINQEITNRVKDELTSLRSHLKLDARVEMNDSLVYANAIFFSLFSLSAPGASLVHWPALTSSHPAFNVGGQSRSANGGVFFSR